MLINYRDENYEQSNYIFLHNSVKLKVKMNNQINKKAFLSINTYAREKGRQRQSVFLRFTQYYQ